MVQAKRHHATGLFILPDLFFYRVTLLVSSPIPSMRTVTSSPAFILPTPGGVPVSITSPRLSVITPEIKATSSSGEKIMSEIVALLPPCAVQEKFHFCFRRRGPGLHPWPQRTESIETLGARPLSVEPLEITRRNIIGAGVAEHMAGSFVHGYLPCGFPDDDRQFSLIVNLFRSGGKYDVLAVSDNRRWRLQK